MEILDAAVRNGELPTRGSGYWEAHMFPNGTWRRIKWMRFAAHHLLFSGFPPSAEIQFVTADPERQYSEVILRGALPLRSIESCIFLGEWIFGSNDC